MEYPESYSDRKLILHNLLCANKEYYGFILIVRDPNKIETVKAGLDTILEKHGFEQSFLSRNLICSGDYNPQKECYDLFVDGLPEGKNLICCSEAYTSKSLEAIEKYLSNLHLPEGCIITKKGSHDDFLGPFWIKEAFQEFRK